MSLTAKEDMPKYSAIPPQTPITDLSVDDFLNFWFNQVPPLLLRKKVLFLLEEEYLLHFMFMKLYLSDVSYYLVQTNRLEQ